MQQGGSVYTVGELTGYIKSLFEADPALSSVSLRGELSNFKRHTSGHLYFKLKDEDAVISAVMFRSSAERLTFAPENGMKVVVRGSVRVYEKTGEYQVYVSSMQPDGLGALWMAYEKLKSELQAEGLFDKARKKPIPRYPRRIGIITSPTGAAVQDMLNVLGRRYPLAEVYLYPALVQGEDAPVSLMRGILAFHRDCPVDVILMGRGGGSIEDLWAFNSRALAYAIAQSEIPIISCVGHETDFTIADFVADLRAPTPSAAAELAVPDAYQLKVSLSSLFASLSEKFSRIIERAQSRLDRACQSRSMACPEQLFLPQERRLADASSAVEDLLADSLREREHRLSVLARELQALSPLSVLARGYAVAQGEDGQLIRSVDQCEVGEPMRLTFTDGTVCADIRSKQKGVSANE